MSRKIRRKTLVGAHMYGLVQGGSYTYFDSGGGPPPDVTAPIISNIQIINIEETTATITWDTNEASDSLVDYGLTSGYGSQQSNASLVTSHSINITGLTANTLYHFKVTSKDAALNSASSTDQTFTTDQLTNALVADGNGDFARRTAGGFIDPSLMTICFWVLLEADINASGCVFGIRNTLLPSGDGYVYFYNPSGDGVTYGWETFNGVTEVRIDLTALTVGVWTFIAITRAGIGANQTIAYRRTIDEVALTVSIGTFSLGAIINEEIVLSNGFATGASFFPGRMCALKEWSDVKSEAQLLAESNHYSPQVLTNLFSFYPMNEDTVAEQVLDQSGNARHFTANGSLITEDGPPNIPFA